LTTVLSTEYFGTKLNNRRSGANVKDAAGLLADRPLLASGVSAKVRDIFAQLGFAREGEALCRSVAKHTAYLERCMGEANATLNGDISAADRLWLLLAEDIGEAPSVPRSILESLAIGVGLESPRFVSGQKVLRLIAGVVRGANQPEEADAMLRALMRLLEPLYLLDLSAAAADQGNIQALKTLAIARSARQWRAELVASHEVEALCEQWTVGRPSADLIRLPFNPDRWKEPPSDFVFPIWKFWICPGGTRKAMSQIDRFGERYTIETISNPQACVGETIIIRGRNFGPAGRIYFPPPDPDDPAFGLSTGDGAILVGVAPVRWTDTEIEVVVPPWATAGELHLNAFTRHVDECSTIDVYRLGNTILFQGGLARVFKVFIAGSEVDLESSQPRNLSPGDAVALTWMATAGSTVQVAVRLMEGGTTLWHRTGLPGGFGGVVLEVPDPAPQQPRSATLVFAATSACGSTQPLKIPVFLSVPPQLTVQYVEVTQGVQGDLGEVLAGRGVATVAHKDTAVRVHMNCDRGGWYSNKLDRITGALAVDGRSLPPTNVRGVVPDRGFAGIRGLSNPENTNDTLNFTIPAAWLTPGPHALTVRVVCNDPTGKIVLVQNFTWSWVPKAPLRVRALWLGGGPVWEQQTAAMLDYTRRALDLIPTPLTDIGIARPGWFSHTYNLTTEDGLDDLLDDIEDLWDDFDEESGVRWLAIIPRFEPLGKSSGRSGVPSIAVLASEDRPDAGAHELGHSLGLHHVNLPVGKPGPPYDVVDGGGMLRRAPFDVRDSKAVSLPAGDLMSYLTPVRPGITTWQRLLNQNF
jgi:hypothetical protein